MIDNIDLTDMRKIRMLRFALALAGMVLAALQLHAQRRITVYDPEAGRPLREALVSTSYAKADTTDIFGGVWVPQKFDTLVVSKAGYVSLRIPYQWVVDTIPLIRDYHQIHEVVVYASRSDDFQRAVKRWTKAEQAEAELRNPITGIGFNLDEVFDKKRRRDRKNAKRLEKIFRQLDADDRDPIIHSYREALKDKLGQ